jgi:hypothetical protein
MRPRITLATLARAMGPITPTALERLLRGNKERSSGPARSYQQARRQTIDFLVDDKPFDVDAPLRTYERDVVRALAGCPPRLPDAMSARRPRSGKLIWSLGEIDVSMQPDVRLEGDTEVGAMKICFTKEPLPRGVGRAMAALLWNFYANVLGMRRMARRSSFLVYEPRLPWMHIPPARLRGTIQNAERAAQHIAALWPTVR